VDILLKNRKPDIIKPIDIDTLIDSDKIVDVIDFESVIGQEQAKRALLIAASG
jgi:predicted ATPase with chaperone activity